MNVALPTRRPRVRIPYATLRRLSVPRGPTPHESRLDLCGLEVSILGVSLSGKAPPSHGGAGSSILSTPTKRDGAAGAAARFWPSCVGFDPQSRAIAYTAGMTGAEKYFAERMRDAEYRKAYDAARRELASPRGLTDKAPTS